MYIITDSGRQRKCEKRPTILFNPQEYCLSKATHRTLRYTNPRFLPYITAHGPRKAPNFLSNGPAWAHFKAIDLTALRLALLHISAMRQKRSIQVCGSNKQVILRLGCIGHTNLFSEDYYDGLRRNPLGLLGDEKI